MIPSVQWFLNVFEKPLYYNTRMCGESIQDRKLQVARINRLKTLSDEEIAMKQYPLRPAPKVAEADAE